MKKLLLVICLLITLIACKKEVSDLQTGYFTRFYGDALDDFGADVEPAPDGGFVIAGTTQRALPRVDTDIMLIITDEYGFQNSETIYFGLDSINEKCTGLLVLEDGYVLTGSFNSNGVDSLLLVKLSTDGKLDWTIASDTDVTWDRTGQGNDIALIYNQIVISGYNLDVEQKKPMFCTFSLEGKKLDLYSPPYNPGDYFTSLQERNGKVFGFGTRFENEISKNDFFLNGESTDIYKFPLPGNETSARIISGSGGGYFIVGTTDPSGAGFNQIIVKKIKDDFSEDLSFNTNPIGADADYRGVDIQEMADGTVAVLGDKTLSKDTDIVLFILNTDGTTQSSKIYGKTGNQSASSLKITPDGGLIILGSNQQEKTNSMITLIKTDKEGNIWE
jgi:hypothetical protein